MVSTSSIDDEGSQIHFTSSIDGNHFGYVWPEPGATVDAWFAVAAGSLRFSADELNTLIASLSPYQCVVWKTVNLSRMASEFRRRSRAFGRWKHLHNSVVDRTTLHDDVGEEWCLDFAVVSDHQAARELASLAETSTWGIDSGLLFAKDSSTALEAYKRAIQLHLAPWIFRRLRPGNAPDSFEYALIAPCVAAANGTESCFAIALEDHDTRNAFLIAGDRDAIKSATERLQNDPGTECRPDLLRRFAPKYA